MATLEDWKVKLAGHSGLEKSEFADLIPRDGNEQFMQEAFATLPNGQILIERIKRLLSENDNSGLYVIPKKENHRPETEITTMLRACCTNVANYLDQISNPELASHARNDKIQVVYTNDAFYQAIHDEPFPHSEALAEVEYQFIVWMNKIGKYMFPLNEAILGLTKYPAVTRYLLEDVVGFPLEHKPYYDLWKAGGDVYFFADRILMLCEYGKA
ncbi:hypothetical protein HB779_08235 [Phyllobacterium sp. 628]|uniref:hypothetical protein n=1 Tax=Phyllobacterium sp. 628 TaxID=2718938 RepID=UPI0016625888|nr:hypothetical protein [Phyllobacterium sp. 628]QND51893.1 hypothetical protein HB779_08235 [Phyllobacterium sp. 628]